MPSFVVTAKKITVPALLRIRKIDKFYLLLKVVILWWELKMARSRFLTCIEHPDYIGIDLFTGQLQIAQHKLWLQGANMYPVGPEIVETIDAAEKYFPLIWFPNCIIAKLVAL